MGIDALQIVDPGGHIVATIARPAGPVESAFYDVSGNEVLVPGLAKVITTANFGIDGSGTVYFDTADNIAVGEMAEIWIDPVGMVLSVMSGADR